MQTDDLDDEETALMCDIAQSSNIAMTPHKETRIAELLQKGLVACRDGHAQPGSGPYKLTGKGQEKLADRGVGVNES